MEELAGMSRGGEKQGHVRRLPARESGAIAIMFAGALFIIIAFFVLALELSQLHNRKMELQNVADSAALAAAPELNGTQQGIENALVKAASRFSISADWPATYQYSTRRMSWAESAIEFGSSPAGPWRVAQDAKARPDGLLYVKVDTRGLDPSYGELNVSFLQVFSNASVVSTSARAVAGRSAIKVTPLGICAMRDEARRNHNGELEEYGFRRGVGYNLLDLNRPGASVGQTFTVNPLVSATPITDVDTLAPFVCTGTMAMARLTGGKVTVSPSFPISSLYYHLNSRFGSYTAPRSPCDARTAPADANIKEYTYDGGSPWMNVQPEGQSANRLETPERRWTVAGPDTVPSETTGAQFGPLWSYAKAVRYPSDEAADEPEPAGGFSTFDTTQWETLYVSGLRESTTTPYPSNPATPTPYSYTSGTIFFKGPSGTNKSIRGRRILNLPLLACPVSGSKAQVLGIGKFFMTRTATASALYGEFAGLVPEQNLGTQVELYP